MPDALGLIDLLTRIGEPHIRVQSLKASLTNARTRSLGDTLLTFGTNQITATDLARGYTSMTGLIIWVPTLRIEQVMRAPEVVRHLDEEKHRGAD